MTRNDYVPMAKYICRKHGVGLPWDEIESIAGLIWHRCRQGFDPDKGVWPIYFYRSLRNALIRAAVKERQRGVRARYYDQHGRKREDTDEVRVASLEAWPGDQPLLLDSHEERVIERVDVARLRDRLRSKMTPTLWRVWYACEVTGLTQGEVARQIGVSRQTVNARLAKAKAEVRRVRGEL